MNSLAKTTTTKKTHTFKSKFFPILKACRIHNLHFHLTYRNEKITSIKIESYGL